MNYGYDSLAGEVQLTSTSTGEVQVLYLEDGSTPYLQLKSEREVGNKNDAARAVGERRGCPEYDPVLWSGLRSCGRLTRVSRASLDGCSRCLSDYGASCGLLCQWRLWLWLWL